MLPPLPVSPEKLVALEQRMLRVGIREAELDEHFVRSGGAGGQNVNKVATCVVLRHPPSGAETKMQRTRTQGLNRYYARVALCEQLETQQHGRASAQQQAIEKIRRQKRKRSARAKAKMVDAKRHRGATKALRKVVLE